MPSIPLYTASELRHIEADNAHLPLMQRAGLAAADLATTLCADRGGRILVLAGPGNNGGDAFEAARLLRRRFFDTEVVFIAAESTLPADAAAAYQRFIDAGGRTCQQIPECTEWSLIIDGLFGIGLKRAISGLYAEQISKANTLSGRDRCPLLALDCPSGLDTDNGQIQGTVIYATHTISFIGGKPGLFTADGPDCCGDIVINDLGIETANEADTGGRTLEPALFAPLLKARRRNTHKGSYGNAGILGGASGMVGGAMLAGRAALRLGSGRVYIGLLGQSAPAFDPVYPELMLRPPRHLLDTPLTALLCGPGMGASDAARALLDAACQHALPLVLDADALNILAGDEQLRTQLSARQLPTLLTPHPTEAARLLACSTEDIQADRRSVALEIATRYKAFVALKGCGTLLATPSGKWFINTSGNPGLSSAGSGDVLSGIITALLAQGWPAEEALCAAVHLHGCAADNLVTQGCGPIGLSASELIDSARHGLNQWIACAGTR